MGAFQSGFQLGQNAYTQAQDAAARERDLAIKEAAESRAATVFAQDQKDKETIEGLKSQLKPNAKNYELNGTGSGNGINVPAQAQSFQDGSATDAPLAASYGLSGPGRGEGGLSQKAPAVGLQGGSQYRQGGFTQAPAPSLADEQRILAQMALVKNDVAGFNAARLAERGYRKDDIAADVMKRPLAEIEAMAPNANLSGIPILYTGKGKGGYTFLKTEADGKTPIPGSEFKVNESQLRQFAYANALAEKGYGADAMAVLQAAHKDLGEHIGKWNATQTAVATTNNTAEHQREVGENGRITANAAARNAQNQGRLVDAHAGLYEAQTNAFEDARAGRLEAAKIADQFAALSYADKDGPVGRGLIRQFNMAIAKAGGQVSLGNAGTGAGKLPQTLTDAQKISYEAAIKELGAFTGAPTLAQRTAIASKYNLPPELLGATSMPNPYGNNGAQAATPTKPTGLGRAKPDLTPVGSVNIAPSPALPPNLPAQAGTPSLLSAAGNGYNIRMPDGSTQFVTYRQAQELGVFPTGGLDSDTMRDLGFFSTPGLTRQATFR